MVRQSILQLASSLRRSELLPIKQPILLMRPIWPCYVSCITDNDYKDEYGTDNIYALHRRYPHATVVKCVAHSLDLMLEDIGKLSYFSSIIEGQKRVVRFVTNHHYSLGLFRQFAKQELLKISVCLPVAPVCSLYMQGAQAWRWLLVCMTAWVLDGLRACCSGDTILWRTHCGRAHLEA